MNRRGGETFASPIDTVFMQPTFLSSEVAMAKAAVHLLVEGTIHDGQWDAFQSVVREMTDGSQTEPGTLGYEWYLSSDRKRFRLLESYTSADALLAHFTGPVVQQLVPKMRQYVTLDRFESYGDPGPQAGAMLAQFGAAVFSYLTGVDR
jgi:quinol monooxygenase YgiN